MSSLKSPRTPHRFLSRLHPSRANRARRLAVFIALLCVFAASASLFLHVRGRASGTTFYSQGSLPPEVLASWSTTRNGVGGVPPTSFTNGDTFVIQNTHNMSTLAAWAISGTNSKLQIESGGTLTANNLVATPNFQIDNGGNYVHNATGSGVDGSGNDIPGSGSRTFGASSNVTIQKWGNTGSSPTALPSASWGNLTINVASLNGSWQQSGGVSTVQGNLSILATGGTTKEFRLTTSTTLTITISGDLVVNGGILNLTSGAGVPTVNVGGNYSQGGGTLTSTGGGIASVVFTGGSSFVTFNHSAGTLTGTNINWQIASGKTVQFNNAFTVAASRTFNINSGGMLLAAATITNNGAMAVNGEFRLTDGGFATGNNFSYGAGGTLGFTTADGYTVNSTDVYWPSSGGPVNVTVIFGGLTMNATRAVGGLFQTSSGVAISGGNTLTFNGTCQINGGGFFSGPPTYGSSSLLKYNIGNPSPAYKRHGEWWAVTSGAGYPANVQITNNTTLDIDNGGTFNSAPSQMSGSLTVDSGSTLTMNSMSQPLIVLGNVTNNGTLALSTNSGGDIHTQGNWSDAGTFTPNGRQVFFEGGAATQTVGKSGGETFAYLVVNKSGGTVKLLSHAGASAPNGGSAITFQTAQSTLTINGFNFTIGGGTISSVAGGGFIGSAAPLPTDALIIAGAGDAGTLPFAGNARIYNLQINRTGMGGNVTLGSPLTVEGNLTLTAGTLMTGVNTLICGNNAATDRVAGSVLGSVQKNFSGQGNFFTFPVSTAAGYAPVDATQTLFSTGSLTVTAADGKQPNVAGADALKRYWTLVGTSITANLTFHYNPADIVGTEGVYKVVKHDANGSSMPANQTINPGAHTATVNGVSTFSDWTLAEPASVFGQIQFVQSNTHTPEGDTGTHNVDIVVQRTGGSSGAVSADYSVTNGTATTADNDYSISPSTGTLNWADGDSADKSITITVNGDTDYEANETVNLKLSGATGGATIASTNPATLTITNDDAPPSTLVVNTTADTDDGFCLSDAGGCTLREAINAANANPNATTIHFDIPANDPGHFYYTDDGSGSTNGHVTIAGHVAPTTDGDDSTIGDIDPDYPHSWWSIRPSTPLPAITNPLTIDGYTQAGAISNTKHLNEGDGAVLRIELDGSGINTNIYPNSLYGLDLETGADGSTVGGLVINHFAQAGIYLQDDGGDTITGNFIGTDASGTLADSTGGNGITINSGESDLVGGDAPDARNLISGHTGGNGLVISVSGNTVEGNYIGTDRSGSAALGNNVGVSIQAGSGNTVGCETLDGDNVISGNAGNGIVINNSADGNFIIGNFIGTKANGTDALGNGGAGVSIYDATNNAVGSGISDIGAANTIAFNIDAGVEVETGTSSASGTGNTIRGNSIHDNGALGIDLGGDGVTPNDPQDADTGPNNLQNFPVITSALVTGSTKTITGTLNSTPSKSFIIDFYAGAACNGSGNGEGQTYLGSLTTANTNANGDTSFIFHPTSLIRGQTITATATATDPVVAGSTSEFSQCLNTLTGTAGTMQFAQSNYTVAENGGVAHITVKRVGGSDGFISATFSTSDGTAHAGSDYTAVTSQTVTFDDGDTADKTVDVSITDDSTYEHDETVNLSLSSTNVNRPIFQNSPQAPVGGTSATLTITDDDAPPSLSIDDVTHNEGNSGTTDYVFTVTKTGATVFGTSVDYATSDGTATIADNDYQSTSGTLNFAPAETTKTVTVHVNGDTTPETDETFNIVLSNPLGATIAHDTGTGTITNDDESVSAGQLIISEFRLRGPGTTSTTAAPAQSSTNSKPRTSVSFAPPSGAVDTSPQANDEFIELYNNTDSPLLVTTTDSSKGWALAASDGVVRFVVPAGTTIPARGHFLGINRLGYSLSGYPAGNDGANPTHATGDPILLGDGTSASGYTLDIPDNAGIAVFRTANPSNFGNAGVRLDAAGSTSESNTLYKEGAGYPALAPADIAQNLEHSFYRSLCSFQSGGCTTPGVPKDTNDNAADFLFVDTGGTPTAAGRRLGAPGPENLSSHIQRNAQIALVSLDRSVAAASPPNRSRDFTQDPGHNSPFGTLSIRRRITNNTGVPVVQLRFRIVEITTSPAASGVADLRALSSGQVSVSNVGDSDTCGGPVPCTLTVQGTTLDEPPTQLSSTGGTNNGGGFNSSLSAGTITLSAPLAPGDSINLQFLFGIKQTGNFRVLLNIEAVAKK